MTNKRIDAPLGDMTEAAPVQQQAAKVQKAGDWHLITYGTWQISVGPDGMLMLPRHLHPNELADFAGAAQVAADIGNQVIADNERRKPAQSVKLNSRSAILTEGPPPPGTVRMRMTTGQQRSAAIGRPKRTKARNPAPEPPVKDTPTRRRRRFTQ